MNRGEFINHLNAKYGTALLSRKQLIAEATNVDASAKFVLTEPTYRVERGKYSVNPAVINAASPDIVPAAQASSDASENVEAVSMAPSAEIIDMPTKNRVLAATDESYVGDIDPNYVSWGNSVTIRKILKSKKFYPTYIVGHTGTGKTYSIEQEAAALGRECFTVSITELTDENDLLGNFRLFDGDTVWENGPVTTAMERGGVLILDELDSADPANVMCLMSVLGSAKVYIKKINKMVKAAPGFTVFATGNTRGRGDDDMGLYSTTHTLNAAFLDRLYITLEQDYPSQAIEKKIILKLMESEGEVDKEFAERLTLWSAAVRDTYFNGADLEGFVSTRGLTQIIHTWMIFKDRLDSVRKVVSSFTEETRDALVQFYEKIDAEASAPASSESESESHLGDVLDSAGGSQTSNFNPQF